MAKDEVREQMRTCPKTEDRKHRWRKTGKSKSDRKFMAKGGKICNRCLMAVTKMGLEYMKTGHITIGKLKVIK